MAQKKAYRKWLPLPQLPTSSPAIQETACCKHLWRPFWEKSKTNKTTDLGHNPNSLSSTDIRTMQLLEHYVIPLASAPPISLETDSSSDIEYENDPDGDDMTSVLCKAENVPSAVKQRRDVENQNDLSSESDYENDYDDGDVVTSVFSVTEKVLSAIKQRGDIKEENDLSSELDYENDYEDGDVVTSVLSGTEKAPSAVKQKRDVEKENEVSSDSDYENDFDDGGVLTSVLSETEKVPLAVKQRREKEKQSDPQSTRGRGRGGRLSLVILYCLVVICFAMCATLLSLFLVRCGLMAKQNLTSVLEELAELKRENGRIAKDVIQMLGGLYDLAGNLTSVPEELAELQRVNERIAKDVIQVQEELHNLTDIFCLSCPHNWQHFERSCYFFSTSRGTWTSAKQSCEAEKAHLVIINNRAEQNFLTGHMISNQVVWIGLSDQVTEGKWIWVNDTPMSLSFWNSGEPNDHGQQGEDCATLRLDATWNDVPCSVSYLWICEQKC